MIIAFLLKIWSYILLKFHPCGVFHCLVLTFIPMNKSCVCSVWQCGPFSLWITDVRQENKNVWIFFLLLLFSSKKKSICASERFLSQSESQWICDCFTTSSAASSSLRFVRHSPLLGFYGVKLPQCSCALHFLILRRLICVSYVAVNSHRVEYNSLFWEAEGNGRHYWFPAQCQVTTAAAGPRGAHVWWNITDWKRWAALQQLTKFKNISMHQCNHCGV